MNTLGALYIVQSLHSAQDCAEQAYFVTLTSSTNQQFSLSICCIRVSERICARFNIIMLPDHQGSIAC